MSSRGTRVNTGRAGAVVARGLALGGVALVAALGGVKTVAAEPLSLPQAVKLAVANNPALEESRANAEATRQARREAGASRWPALELREVALRTNSPADAFGLQLMQEKFSFPDFVAGDPNEPAPINNFATEIQASWPLFTGGKLRAGVQQAGHMQVAAEAMRDHTQSAVALQTVTTYMQALLADRFVALAAKAEATTARHIEQAQDFFDAGMLVESDLLQARVQLARMQENYIEADNAARLAHAALNRVMGVDQSAAYELDPEPTELPPDSTALAEAVQRALAARADLKAVNAKTTAAANDVARAQGDYWPEVALVGKYAWNDDRILGFHGDSYTVLGMARWNLWNWGQTRAGVGRSRSQQMAAEQLQRAYRQQVEFEVRSAWQAVAEARARQQIAAQAVSAAERALAILDDRFSQGVTRITELLDAETLAHEARVREAQARFDLQRATRTVRFATGGDPAPEVAEGGTTTP